MICETGDSLFEIVLAFGLAVPHLIFMRTAIFQLYTFFTATTPLSGVIRAFQCPINELLTGFLRLSKSPSKSARLPTQYPPSLLAGVLRSPTRAGALNFANDPLQIRSRDLSLGEPHDRPSGEERLKIFLGVGNEASGAIVPAAAVDEDAALDLNQRPAFHVGKISPPSARRIKLKLWRQRRSAESTPVEGEFRFELGGI